MGAKSGHFVGLDGMRGVAAVAVMLFHLGAMNGPVFAPHGYLAVDFFFMLSGLVIARAYEGRFIAGSLGTAEYMWRRIRRLYLVVGLGLLIGLGMHVFSGDAIPASWMLSFAFIPLLFVQLAFPLNNPVWSLALELLINFVHALAARKLTLGWLAAVVGVSAAGLIAVGIRADSINVGWGMFGDRQHLAIWLGGLPRVAFGFFLGVAIWRARGMVPKVSVAWPLIAAILAAALVLPFPGSALTDLVCALVVFPMILIAGFSSEPTARLQPFAKWLGMISYPLYGIHYPILQGAVRLEKGLSLRIIRSCIMVR